MILFSCLFEIFGLFFMVWAGIASWFYAVQTHLNGSVLVSQHPDTEIGGDIINYAPHGYASLERQFALTYSVRDLHEPFDTTRRRLGFLPLRSAFHELM